MDIGMPDLNGIEATRQIKAAVPKAKVVALSMHSERRFVTGMLEAGASGSVLKAGAFEEVVASIRAVLENRIFTRLQHGRAGLARTATRDRIGHESRIP